MPHAPRQVSPTWCELLCFIFLYAWQQTDHPHMLLQRATSPITSLPDLFFPLCWAQCSFLAWCTLIVALLAYLDLVETKHWVFFFMICREGRQWQHFVVNGLAMRGTIGMLSQKSWEKGGRAYLFAESWTLCAHNVQCVEVKDDGRGGFFPLLMMSCPFVSLFLPGYRLFAGTEGCFMFTFTLACYTPKLCCSMSAMNLLGQQVLMRCTADHTTQQLWTHCSVYTWPLKSNTHWGKQTHCYPSQASSSHVLYGIIRVLILKLTFLSYII